MTNNVQSSRRTIYGIGETHPGALLIAAFSLLDNAVQRITYGAPFQAEIRGYKDFKSVLKYYAEKVEQKAIFDEEEEARCWSDLRKAVSNISISDKQESLNLLERAESIAKGVKETIYSLRPDTLYLEGIEERYYTAESGILTAARKVNAPVVFLDKGFQPYEDYQEGRIGEGELHKGREPHWIQRIIENPPKERPLLVIGNDHITGSRKYPDDIGHFPQLLRENGFELKLLKELVAEGYYEKSVRQ